MVSTRPEVQHRCGGEQRWVLCLLRGSFSLGEKYFHDGLTSTALPAMMLDMKTASALGLATDDSLRASRLTLSRQAGVPVGKSHGGGVPERPNPETAAL